MSVGKRVGLCALVVLTAYVATCYRYFVIPSTDEVGRADAIVVLSGAPDRIPRALELLRDGVSDTVVLSWGSQVSAEDRQALLAAGEGVTIVDFDPVPDTTQGEARAIGALAQRHGWESVVGVTSTYHITRARTLVDRCTDVQVSWVDSTPDLTALGWAGAIAHESGGMVWSVLSASC